MTDDTSTTEPLPYRLLTGTDDRAFCEKISGALLEGYVLYGGPTIAVDADGRVVTAQAVVLRGVSTSS